MSSVDSQAQASHRFKFPPWLTGRWGMVGIITILYTLINIAWTYFHWGGPNRVSLIANLFSFFPSLMAVIAAWRVATHKNFSRPLRRAWFILGVCFLMFLIGNVLWAYLEVVLRVEPFPSIADVFYLAFYPIGLWGLLALPGAHQNRRERLILWLDLLCVLTAAAMFVLYFIIVPTAADGGSDFLSQVIAPAYPIGSLILTGGLLAILYRRPSSDRQAALNYLLLGMIFFLSSDFAFGYTSLAGTYTIGGWTDAGWNIAQLFFVLAALRKLYHDPASAMAQRQTILGKRLAQGLPYVAILLGYGLVIYVVEKNFGPVAVSLMAGALLLTLLVIARQIISPTFADLPVRAKVILTVILVSALSVSLVSVAAYLTIRSNLEVVVGESLKADVEIRSQTLGNEISKQADLLQGFALSETIENGVNAASTLYTGDPAIIYTQLQQQDLAWVAALDTDPFVLAVLNNPITAELHEFLDKFPVHSDLLLTDKYGATIAATAQPANYYQGAQDWWQTAYNRGQGAIYIGQPTLDPTTHTISVIIAVPARADLDAKVIGVIRTTYVIQNILEVITSSHLETHGDFALLLSDGGLLHPHGDVQELDADTVARLQASQDADYVQMSFEGTQQLVSQARVASPDSEDADAFKNLNLRLIAHEEPAVAFAPLHAAWRTTLLTTLFVLLLTTGLAVILAQVLIAPISRLTDVASKIASGDLSTKAQVESRDEIGTLATTFNSMLDGLSRAQQDVQESEALYRSLVDYSPDMIMVHSGGRMLFINPAGVKMLSAQSADELIGQPILDIVPLQDRENAQHGIEQAQTTRERTPLLQQKLHRLDGTSFEAEFRAIPISYAGQAAVQFVMRDITERKEAEEKIRQLLVEVARQAGDLERRVAERTEELQESQERFRLIFDTSPDGIFLIDPHDPAGIWRIVDCNPSAGQMNGYTREELIGQDLDLLNLTRNGPEQFAPTLERLRRGTVMRSIEAVHRHKDGHIIPIEYSTALITINGRELIIGIDRDVTERKQTEERLMVERNLLSTLIDNLPDYIFVKDVNSRLLLDNIAHRRLLGTTHLEEVVGKTDFDFFPRELAAPYIADEVRIIESGEAMINHEEPVIDRDGNQRWLLTTKLPLRDSQGMITGIVGINRDITEQKQAEEALRQTKELAEEASRAKSEFLSRMSHELRTPMNAILGFAQLLNMSRKEPLSEIQKERVRQIVKGGQHLLDLINEILDISRIEAGRVQISPEPVSIRESIQEALDLTMPLAADRHILLQTSFAAGDNPYVMADRQRLKQVFLNLLSNAVKYNYDGGNIMVSCEKTRADGWRISVTNTGRGISQEDIPHLFIPFERLSADKSNVEGTGLGLALAKRLIELMEGQIGMDSVMGQGSTFWIELPLAESQLDRLKRTGGGTGALPAISGSARKILYIEDNIANFELIQQVLADYGQVELLWSTEAEAGLELAHQHRPNLILLDLHLGRSDGGEVLRRLKQDDQTADIPVVVVSADATPEQIKRLLALGAHSYLTKPLDIKIFVELIKELLNEKVA